MIIDITTVYFITQQEQEINNPLRGQSTSQNSGWRSFAFKKPQESKLEYKLYA